MVDNPETRPQCGREYGLAAATPGSDIRLGATLDDGRSQIAGTVAMVNSDGGELKSVVIERAPDDYLTVFPGGTVRRGSDGKQVGTHDGRVSFTADGTPETCPQCGREYLQQDTGSVSFGDAPEAARDYCSRTPTFSDVEALEVYWHSAAQLAQEVDA